MDAFDRAGRLVRAAFTATRGAALHALAEDVRRRLGVEGHGIPSAPGKPPHKQTGELQASVRADLEQSAVVVDHPAAYYLEYGTTRMKARPFARPGLVSFGARAARLVARAMGTPAPVKLGARHSPGQPLE